MKKLLCILYALIIIIMTGCSSTRKTVQEDWLIAEAATETTQETAELQQSESVIKTTDTNENLNVSLDFTKIEFEDGTTICDLLPIDAIIRSRESDEPPDFKTGSTLIENISLKPTAGIKSITTGRMALNNEKNEQSKEENKKDSDLQISNNSQFDTTTEITHQTNTQEKEKHGGVYWLGVFSAIGIVFLFLVCICIFAYKLRNRLNK